MLRSLGGWCARVSTRPSVPGAYVRSLLLSVGTLLVSGIAAPHLVSAKPLKAATTVTELGSLVREIGGEQVEVTVFAKPTEDPHFIMARPSFVKVLSEADLLVLVGLDLEQGWLPELLNNARNGKILPGAPGYVDASVVITPMQVPLIPVTRAMGDIHPRGNPHYLLDPLAGLKVAALVRDTLIAARPGERRFFEERYEDFARRVYVGLVGEALVGKYDVEKLALLYEYDKLSGFLEGQGELTALGGWFGRLREYYGAKAVGDHMMWVYFARRFGIEMVEHLEPLPGIRPSTKHLRHVVEIMRNEDVKILLAAAYYDPRHADFVASETGATVLRMANHAGARPGTDDYLAMVQYNVDQLAAGLEAR